MTTTIAHPITYGFLDDKWLVQINEGDAGFRHGSRIDGHGSWPVLPLRPSASGHEFIDAFRRKQILEIIKQDFTEAGIDTLWRVSKDLLQADPATSSIKYDRIVRL